VSLLLALGIQEAVVLLATETRAQEGRVVADSRHVTAHEAKVEEDPEAVLGVTTIRHEEVLPVDQEAVPPLPQTKSSLFSLIVGAKYVFFFLPHGVLMRLLTFMSRDLQSC